MRLYGYFTAAHDKATSKETRKALRKICRIFGKAIDNSVGGVQLSSLRERERDENESIYKAIRAEYLALAEEDRAAWLEEHGYTEEDFAEGVLDEDYQAAKAEYLALAEEDRAAWLEEHGYTKEDFAEDVLDEDYQAAKAEYLSLAEEDRAAWLEEHGYTEEDFAEGVLDEERGQSGEEKTGTDAERDFRYAFKGRAKDGKGIYESNFPKGSPKSAKTQRILDYIINIWSKKPIGLVISNGETSRTILAQFDPTVDASQNTPTDASKLAGGNRHGNHTEQRVTLDLADDYYQIASEAVYNYSKEETGKEAATHSGVKMWHYFVNDIYFAEHGETELTPYTVTINVKEKADGNFVYSFNAEKAKEHSTRQTLHAAVNTRKGANGELFIDSITETSAKSNPLGEKSSGKFSSPESDERSSYAKGKILRSDAAHEGRGQSGEGKVRKGTNNENTRVTGDNHAEAPVITGTDVAEDTRFALLTDEDLTEYMATGKTLHTRHKKQRMLENGKKPILTSESEIKEFISNAIQGKAGGEVRAFARVPKRLADAISEVRNSLDLEDDYLEFQADALREAYKVHSSPKMQGDIALTESDFENLHRHIFDFDGVLSVNDYNGKTEIHIYRCAENGYYQIITVSSSERKSLQITKLIGVSKEKFEGKYAKKIERNTGSPRMLEASNPSTKARHTAGALSTDSITETSAKSNPLGEKSSGKFSSPESDERSSYAKGKTLRADAAREKSNTRFAEHALSYEAETKEAVDSDERMAYNKKRFKFLHKNFPPENEVHSEAHRLAVWWANNKEIQTGDQTLISMNDRWYLVEKFDDAENHYQVEEHITKAEFKQIFKEIKENGRSAKIKSISGSVVFLDKLNQSGYSLEGRKSSSSGYETQYGRENNKVQRVGKKQIEGRERPSSNREGDSEGGGSNRQGQDPNLVKRELLEKDLRFSKVKGNGHVYKEIAQVENLKVYEKEDAEKIINNIMSVLIPFSEDGSAMLSNKNKKEAEQLLWERLNLARGEAEVKEMARRLLPRLRRFQGFLQRIAMS